MRKLLDYVKKNKKLIIVIALLIALICIVYFIDFGKKGATATSSTTTKKSETEVKLTAILSSIDGVGEADVMIHESNGAIVGVIIVCEGANNIMTRNDILNAVATALNVPKSIIAIYSMNV